MPITPLARKLDATLAYKLSPFIAELCRRELADRLTRCEFPESCSALATSPYRNTRTVIYLCDLHYKKVVTATGGERIDLDVKISLAMYRGLLAKSFIWTNNQTAGALGELIEAHEIAVKKANQAAQRANARLLAEQRGTVAADAMKIGAPDEDLLTGRDRNDIREKLRRPRIGPARTVPVVNPVPAVLSTPAELDLITPRL